MTPARPMTADPLAYAEDLELFIAPLEYGTKSGHLTEHGHKSASRNPDQIRAWIAQHGPQLNWLLWAAPSGLLVIDWETDAGRETMREWGLWDVPTLRVITARGAHHYFRSPASGDIETITLGPATTLRHRKGYTLLPQSRHPSGHIYRWQGGLADLRPLPDAVVQRLRACDAAKAAAAAPPGAERRLALPLEPVDAALLDHRIARYLARVGNRSEGSRNVCAFQISAWLTHDMGLTADAAWPWLAAWNLGCQPPLAERELRQVLQSAERTGTRPIGSGRRQRTPR